MHGPCNPCLNGGMFLESETGYNCFCANGFTGNKCQTGKGHDIIFLTKIKGWNYLKGVNMFKIGKIQHEGTWWKYLRSTDNRDQTKQRTKEQVDSWTLTYITITKYMYTTHR